MPLFEKFAANGSVLLAGRAFSAVSAHPAADLKTKDEVIIKCTTALCQPEQKTNSVPTADAA